MTFTPVDIKGKGYVKIDGEKYGIGEWGHTGPCDENCICSVAMAIKEKESEEEVKTVLEIQEQFRLAHKLIRKRKDKGLKKLKHLYGYKANCILRPMTKEAKKAIKGFPICKGGEE